jgi:hypothetical protein
VIQLPHGVGPPAQFDDVPPMTAKLSTTVRSGDTTSLVHPPLKPESGSYRRWSGLTTAISPDRPRFSWLRPRTVVPFGPLKAAIPSNTPGVG